MKFADTLPELSKPHIPYPNPKDASQVCANRLAALETGAVKRHYFPLTAPNQQTWTELLERVAMLENQMEELALKNLDDGRRCLLTTGCEAHKSVTKNTG